MKKFYKYYVVDSVSESIVGSFDAINFDMACMILKKGVLENPKFKDFSEQLVLYRDKSAIEVFETYDEVVNALEAFLPESWKIDNDRPEN